MAYKIQSILFLFIIWLFAESQRTLLDKSIGMQYRDLPACIRHRERRGIGGHFRTLIGYRSAWAFPTNEEDRNILVIENTRRYGACVACIA